MISEPLAAFLSVHHDDHYDFGLVQAIDCLWGVALAKNEFPKANWSQLSAIGLSHGGYLVNQCHKLAPNSFALTVNAYGWVKPYDPWILPFQFYQVYDCQGVKCRFYPFQYWQSEPTHPFYFSPARREIRTLASVSQLDQWANQAGANKGKMIFTQQIDDEMHPRAEKEAYLEMLTARGFQLEYFPNATDSEHKLKSLTQGANTSFKGMILDFIHADHAQPIPPSQSEFETRGLVKYWSHDSLYQFDYTSGYPVLKISSGDQSQSS